MAGRRCRSAIASIDLRIATLPTSFGERVVIRLLDKSARLYDLPELGMDAATLGAVRAADRRRARPDPRHRPDRQRQDARRSTPPCRSINSNEKNILTLEDPIEYQLEGISQTQVSEKKGMTFASGLRSVLRQDPDVIMVGEIRDRETAMMAIQSSLTGHLVFSTLHTNDAASAVTRLLDLGIEPYLVASSLGRRARAAAGAAGLRALRRAVPAHSLASWNGSASIGPPRPACESGPGARPAGRPAIAGGWGPSNCSRSTKRSAG